ncbi:MAG TPA: outer membrane lipoprotein chaperone LolA [Terriglobales bacterium]|nr:outer membrane lipoprotein chaperone LolA [Terriglobales bacterium]
MNSNTKARAITIRTAATILLMLALCAAAIAGPPDVSTVAGNVDRHYNNLRSFEAEFTESYRGAGIERNESGTLWLKRPGKMRWEYRQPKPKLFISDGKNAWFYVPGERQARKTSVKKLEDLRSPLQYLLGHTKLEKEFAGLSFAPDIKPAQAGDVVLRGVPRNMQGIQEVLLEITPEHQIARIAVDEVDGAVTEYTFSGQKENVQIADNAFRFSAPPGTEVIEADIGQ